MIVDTGNSNKSRSAMIDKDNYDSLYHELKNYISFLNTALQMYEFQHEDLSNDPQWCETRQISKRIMNISNVLPLCDLASSYLPASTDMLSFFQSYLRDFEATHEDEDCQLFVSVEENLPNMFVDPAQLRMALNQLTDNAYEATAHCGDIFMKAFMEDGRMQITVKDFGPGIPEELFDKLFQPGFTTKENSLGLGLNLARTAVELSGGTICAQNNPICGATFTISLPVRPPADS